MQATCVELRSESAPAKVNLFLHVTGRRADGYHLLDSVAVFAGLADRIVFEPSDTLSLTIAGPFAPDLSAEPDNLVLRAARILAAESGIHLAGALGLDKRIPVASGIGGGSADAAAAFHQRLVDFSIPAEAPLVVKLNVRPSATCDMMQLLKGLDRRVRFRIDDLRAGDARSVTFGLQAGDVVVVE